MKKFLFLAFMLMIAVSVRAGESGETEFLQQGRECLASGRYQNAVRAFEQAARLNPGSAEAQLGMGESYLKLGDNGAMVNPEMLEKATAAFNRALAINPNLAEARHALGVTCLALDDRAGAARQYELLKNIDQAKAQDLSARIDAYRPARSFRAVGGSGEKPQSTGNRQGKSGATVKPPTRFTGSVDLYGADWCPHCRAAVQYMTSKGISFVYHKIEEDAVAKSEYRALGGGGIPLIALGGRKIMNGFSPETLEYHLKNYR